MKKESTRESHSLNSASIYGPVGTALRLFSLGFAVEDAAKMCDLPAPKIQTVINKGGLDCYEKAKSRQYLYEDARGWAENRKRWEQIAATF